VQSALQKLGELGIQAQGFSLDHCNETQVKEAFSSHGPFDVLINNAGQSHAALLEKQDLETWERMLASNATGPFLCSREALPSMREKGFGRIIFIASTASLVGTAYTSAYTASKHAVLGLMRSIAAETKGSKLTCNAICPTFVDTEMTQRTLEQIMKKTGRSHEEALKSLLRGIPLGRLLQPQEIAATALFLASDAAQALHGQAIVLDGGGIQS
jgi:NAD(P)-dependent dehydrogenase (short-subunit alcohol dehydrogenase family)